MPVIEAAGDRVCYAVLIPSCGRADRLRRNWKRMPFLNHPDTYLGVHTGESALYRNVTDTVPLYRTRLYPNPTGSVAVAREALRAAVIDKGRFDYYVVTDDNATYTQDALTNLVRAAHEYTTVNRVTCTMAGMHNTAPHFDRRLIEQTRQTLPSGLTTYANVTMIFQCYPHPLFADYQYPPDAYGLDDRHFYLWCVARGIQHFRVCMEAPFNKARYQEGGQGDIPARAWKNGVAIARLATDFPDLVGAAGTLRIPWQLILKLKAGMTADRLAGGSMRREDQLVRSATLKARKR